MKKKLMIFTYILISIPILLFFLYNLSRVTRNIKEHYCLKNSYDISYVTDTIQTLGKKDKYGHRWIMRGKIEKFYDYRKYVVGYLTIKYPNLNPKCNF